MKQYLTPNQVKTQNDFYSKWPDLVFLADAEQEDFADVQIVTLNEYRKQQAIEQAADLGGDIRTIKRNAKKLEKTIPAVEFVEVFEDHIKICLRAERVDDHLVNRAMQILSNMTEFVRGQRLLINELTPYN